MSTEKEEHDFRKKMYDRLDEVDRKAGQITRLKLWIKKQ